MSCSAATQLFKDAERFKQHRHPTLHDNDVAAQPRHSTFKEREPERRSSHAALIIEGGSLHARFVIGNCSHEIQD